MKTIAAFSLLMITLTANAQSVEDTLKHQIGYGLHYYDDVAPGNITVIGARHYPQSQHMPFPEAEYRYINHNRTDVGYKWFSEAYLREKYESFFSADTAVNRFNLDWPELYQQMVDQALAKIGTMQDSPAVGDYTGYWVYLCEYRGEYYLEQRWDCIPSFRICVDRIDMLDMEGPSPYLIKSASGDENSGIVIKTPGDDAADREISFSLVDRDRKIYRFSGRYVTPASNSASFELIQYANRSGDLIVW